MVHLDLLDTETRPLIHYLAIEEYAARHLDELVSPDADGGRGLFFIWSVKPTVIFGRNQVMEAEVNLPYCHEHGIELYRRKSGGGCVYSDPGNLMLSFITDRTDVSTSFDRFLDRLASSLSALGPVAERTGRNDILIGGRKVSGNAFFMTPNASIVHGTLLFDTDFDALEKAITPSQAKISSKGVSSVRQHVINFREALEAEGNSLGQEMTDITRFKSYLTGCFCSGSVTLSGSGMEEVRAIEATYLDPEFLSGRKHSWSVERSARIDGIGEVSLGISMEGEFISSCHLSGDFLPVRDGIDEALNTALKGLRDNDLEAGAALSGINFGKYVPGLDGKLLRRYLFKQEN